MKLKKITDIKLKYLLVFFKREYFPNNYYEVYNLTGLTRNVIDRMIQTGYVVSKRKGFNRVLSLTKDGEELCDSLLHFKLKEAKNGIRRFN